MAFLPNQKNYQQKESNEKVKQKITPEEDDQLQFDKEAEQQIPTEGERYTTSEAEDRSKKDFK